MKKFGIGKIGAIVVGQVAIAAMICIAITAASAFGIFSGLKFNGDVADLLKVDTPGYRALQRVETEFHPFSTDEIVVVESAGFNDADTYRALEDFVSELNLVTGVEAVLSVYSLPGSGGMAEPYLSSELAGQLPPEQRLEQLAELQPLAEDLLSKDMTTTLVILMIAQPAGDGQTVLSPTGRAEIDEIINDYAPALTVTIGGMSEVHRSIEEALRKDQRSLATYSTLLCVLLSLVVFRSWRGALICAIPPVTGALWFFGFAAFAGITIDPITTIIPTLLIVVGFADSVHLYFSFLRLRRNEPVLVNAVRTTIEQTGPACFLTSLTTAVACLGIGLAGSEALNNFAVGGFFGMAIQFLAVILLFPLLALWLSPKTTPQDTPPVTPFGAVGRAATDLLDHSWPVIVVSVLVFGGLLYTQSQLQIGFRLSEHLRDDSPLRKLEIRLSEKSLGSGQLFVVVKDADGKKGITEEDIENLKRIGEAVYSGAGSETAMFPSIEQIERLNLEGHPLLKRYVAQDGLSYLLPVAIDPSLLSGQIVDEARSIGDRLRTAGFDETFEIVGLPLLSATEVPIMIANLRLGFYVALALVVFLLVYATGSFRLGLISLIPNLIPILGVEGALFIMSQQLTMTAAVALTIAFGIAVDNSIHLLNRYQLTRAGNSKSAISEAIRDVASPIAATTVLLVAGLLVTQISSLPTVATFGQLVSAALILALFSSLFLLPSFVEPGKRRKANP